MICHLYSPFLALRRLIAWQLHMDPCTFWPNQQPPDCSSPSKGHRSRGQVAPQCDLCLRLLYRALISIVILDSCLQKLGRQPTDHIPEEHLLKFIRFNMLSCFCLFLRHMVLLNCLSRNTILKDNNCIGSFQTTKNYK